MKNLNRLWHSIEGIPGPAAVLAEWRHRCGADFPILEPLLKPTEMTGASYPCPDCPERLCSRDIMDYGDGEILAVCRNQWAPQPDVPISRADTVVHDIDVASLTRAVTGPLGIRWQQPTPRAPGVWALGVSNSRLTRNHPAYLFISSRRCDFRSAVHEVALSCPTPFVAVAPTSTFLTAELQEVLSGRKSTFVSLEDRVGLSEDGRFVAMEATEGNEFPPTPVEMRHAVVEKYKLDFDCTDEAIYEDAGVHKSDFYKWMRGALSDKSSKSKRIEETLRTDPRLRDRR